MGGFASLLGCSVCFNINYRRRLYSDNRHISFISSPTAPKCKGFGETQEPAPHGAAAVDVDAHLLVGDLQQLQHHGMGAHVPEQALLLLPALPHRGALLDTEFAESNQNLVYKERIKVSPLTPISVPRTLPTAY